MRELLEDGYRRLGPAALLRVGRGLDDVDFHPLIDAVLRAAGPGELIERWIRLERFGHSRNRTRVIDAGTRSLELRRYARRGSGSKPSDAENLVILGLVAVLLERAGCRGLRASVGRRGPEIELWPISRSLPDRAALRGRTARWWIRWRAEQRAPELPGARGPQRANAHAKPRPGAQAPERVAARGADGVSTPSTALPVARDFGDVAARATSLLAGDPGRHWCVASLAAALGCGPRTLQRRLRDADLAFSELLRAARTREACRLLTDSDWTLATIGFCCGFADAAHFSREFSRAAGLPPSAYRAAARGGMRPGRRA